MAVLFGSHATGRARPDSDVDIAILPARRDVSRRKLLSDVAVALADASPQGRVDVVFLDEAPPLLRQRIMESGIVLVLRDEDSWHTWRIRTMREYGDREPVRHLFRNRLNKRLTEGTSHGRSRRALNSLERTGKLQR